MRRLLLALCSLVILAARTPAAEEPPAAEPIGFSSRADKNEISLGAPFGYTIEVRHAPSESYALPSALQLEPFEATGGTCRRDEKGQEVVTICTLQLALFELGAHDIPEIALQARTPSGDRVLRVPGPPITGVGMLDPNATEKDLQLRDIAPPAPLLVRTYRVLVWAGIALAIVGLSIAAIVLWRRRRARIERIPPLAPHERFQRQLEALDAEALPQHGRGREFFFRLSERVREYLGALCGLNALDLTTEEILSALVHRDQPGLDRDALAVFCRRADVVKFARHDPSSSECGEAMAYARDLLAKTLPPPPGAPADGGAQQARSTSSEPNGPKAA